MAKTVDYYKKAVARALKANNTNSKALELQVYSLASALRNLDLANEEIDELTSVTVLETTRYGEKTAPHPAFKVAKEAQDSITRQMKSLNLTAEDMLGGEDDDPLVEVTARLTRGRLRPKTIKPKG